jgi:hypothetical protein
MVWIDSLLESVWMNFYGKVLGWLFDGLDEFSRKSLWMNFCGKVLGYFLEDFFIVWMNNCGKFCRSLWMNFCGKKFC